MGGPERPVSRAECLAGGGAAVWVDVVVEGKPGVAYSVFLDPQGDDHVVQRHTVDRPGIAFVLPSDGKAWARVVELALAVARRAAP